MKRLLHTIDLLEEEIKMFDVQIRHLMKGHNALLDRMKKATSIADVSSCEILAEVGPDLTAFPTVAAMISWAGLCPGNNESAGKRKSGKSPVRKHHLKTIMIEVAWAAIKKKGAYFKDKYYRLKSRHGAKKAIVAIAHRILMALSLWILERITSPGEIKRRRWRTCESRLNYWVSIWRRKQRDSQK